LFCNLSLLWVRELDGEPGAELPERAVL